MVHVVMAKHNTLIFWFCHLAFLLDQSVIAHSYGYYYEDYHHPEHHEYTIYVDINPVVETTTTTTTTTTTHAAPTIPHAAPTIPQPAPTIPQPGPIIPQPGPTIPQPAPTIPQPADITTTGHFSPEDLQLDVRENHPTTKTPTDDNPSKIFFPGSGGSKCSSEAKCISIDKCPSASRSNTICGWDDNVPRLCCLTGTEARVKPEEESVLLTKEIIPESQCFSSTGNEGAKIKKRELPLFGLTEEEASFTVGPFVVGGDDVLSNKEWPFMASIYIQTNQSSSFLCGGALISKSTVLSASHCFMDRDKDTVYFVRFGQSDLNSTIYLQFKVDNVILHPNFNYPNLYNDIAVLHFKGFNGPNGFDDHEIITVRPICLPHSKTFVNGIKNGTVLGWGSKFFTGGNSAILQKAIVPLVNNDKCEETYKTLGSSFAVNFPEGLKEKNYCAGNVDEAKDACQGDSGGPLVALDSNNVWRLIGVVSVGYECGRVGFPGVYTRVDNYLEWISLNAN